jgi:hypothetical protein
MDTGPRWRPEAEAMTKTIGGKAKRIKRQARLFRRYVRWLVAFTEAVHEEDDRLDDDALFPRWLNVEPMDPETLRILTAQERRAQYKQGPLLCGACSAGRPEDCSGWCANYHAGVTE